jgi:hypothetical protein
MWEKGFAQSWQGLVKSSPTHKAELLCGRTEALKIFVGKLRAQREEFEGRVREEDGLEGGDEVRGG